jgi:hypothetical protein
MMKEIPDRLVTFGAFLRIPGPASLSGRVEVLSETVEGKNGIRDENELVIITRVAQTMYGEAGGEAAEML